LASKNDALSRAQRLAERAQYDEALSALEETQGGEAAVLKAQMFVRQRRYSEARKCLESIKDAPRSVEAEAAILLTSIADRLAISKAGSASSVAVPAFPAGVDARTRSQRFYYEALAHWTRGSGDVALELIRKVTSGDDPLLRAWGLDLEAWIAVRRGKYRVAAKTFRSVLDALERSPSKDELTRCGALHGLCFTSVETLATTYFRRITAEAQAMIDSAVTARLRVQIWSYVSIIEALEGRRAGAYRALLSAHAIDVAEPFRALPEIQLAAFHRERGALDTARLHLDFAKECLDAVDWNDVDVEGRLVLALYIVEAAAERARPPAITTLRVLSIDGKRDPMLALDGNKLAAAMAYFSRANLSLSLDKVDSGMADLEHARDIWREEGWTYRAAIAELAMFRIDESTNISTLDTVVSTFPNSGLATDVRKAREQAKSPLRLLSAAEKRVLSGICEGLTSKQIAEQLDRSHETVRVQTLSIYRKLGVNTRSAVVALMRDADVS